MIQVNIARYLLSAVLAGCATALPAMVAAAASPSLKNLLPVAGQRGETVEVRFYGERLDDASQVLFHTQGITAEQMQIQRGKHVIAKFRIAPDAPLGEHHVRVLTESGVTEMISFRVVDRPIVKERPEEEKGKDSSSTSFEDPQPIALGQVVLGRTFAEDVDYYAVDLKKGQRLSVQVDGMRLGRGFTDSHLVVLDEHENELAACDDTHLLRQDPYLGVIAPEDGRYIIKIRDSGYEGSTNNWYLLHVGSFIRPGVVFPLGGKPGEQVDLRFMGDTRGDFTQRITLPKSADNDFEVLPEIDGQRPPTSLPFRVNHLANVFEAEFPTNDGMQQMDNAPVHLPPVAFNGTIEKADDHDYFKLSLKKDEAVYIRCHAGSMGSPLDSVVNVFDAADKKHLQGNDDSPDGPDSVIEFKAPADGEYFLRVRDHRKRGGKDYVYRLEVTAQSAWLSSAIERYDQNKPQDRQAIAVPRGNRTASLVRVQHSAVGGDIKPVIEGLPQGVRFEGYAPAGRGEMLVVFDADGNAPLDAGMVELCAQGTKQGDSADTVRGGFNQRIPLVIANPNRTEYYHATLKTAPVAVTRKVPAKIDIVPPKAPIVRDGVMKLKVNVTRDEGFKGQVRTYLLWRPPGIGGAGQVDLNGDATEAQYHIDANGGAELREWPMVIYGYVTTPEGPVWVSSQLFKLKVEEPFVTGKIDKASCIQGAQVDILVPLEHPRGWEGEGELKLMGLPSGCEVQALKIKPGQDKAVFTVKTAGNAPVGRHSSLMCELTIQVNGEPVIHRFGSGGQLRIDRPSKQKDQKE